MQAIIIAAGESSRFWPLANGIHKSQVFLMGKPIIYWTLKGLAENGIKDAIIVCSPDSSMQTMLEQENDLGMRLSFVAQEKPLGTGNALWQAREFVKGPFLAVWPNKVNAGELVKQMRMKQEETGAAVCLAGAKTETPWDYGMARFDGDRVVEIAENPERGKEPSRFKVIGAYMLEPDFFSYYEGLEQHHEADFISALNARIKNDPAAFVELADDVPALKYPWELFSLRDILFSSAYFKPEISKTARVAKSAVLAGAVRVEDGAVVKEGVIIEGPCYIGKGCEIGYNSVLRGPVDLEEGVKTGAFCEMKNAVVQKNTHFHSGYIGDSLFGRDCRIGANFSAANKRLDRGEIACAVKGKKIMTGRVALGAIVGDNARIGIHAGTMPGACIGSDVVVGPGTIVFKNLEDKSAVYAKQDTVFKQGD